MNITYDAAKNERNIEKHGISLAAAVYFEWEEAQGVADDRKNYGEDRQCAIGYIGNRLFYMVYVDRGEARRIISLRKAKPGEVKRYAEA
jgi:uncharacterized DUF497 family protein